MFKLALIHLRRYLKNPTLLLMMGPVPLLLVIFSQLTGTSEAFNPEIALVLNANGPYEQQLVDELNLEDSLVYKGDESTPIEKLKAHQLAGVIVLPETFSSDLDNGKKPHLIRYITENGAGISETEIKIENLINTYLKNYYQLTKQGPIMTTIEVTEDAKAIKFTMFISLIIYFMFIGASTLAKDVHQLKQQKILHRSLSTANKDYELFGGLILAMCLIQGSCFSLIYYLGLYFLQLHMPNPFFPLLLMFSMSFVASSLVIFITRILKQPLLIELSIIVYALVGFIFTLLTLNLFDLGLEASLVDNLAKLFPIYWAFDSALHLTLWPNLFIIALFGLAFLSAGSFKLKNFIQK